MHDMILNKVLSLFRPDIALQPWQRFNTLWVGARGELLLNGKAARVESIGLGRDSAIIDKRAGVLCCFKVG